MSASNREPELVTLEAGQTLFREGDPADSAYLVESGYIDVRGHDEEGRAQLSVLGAGALLGEMSLIDRQPRTATAVAAVATQLRKITWRHYEDCFQEADPLLRVLLRALLQRHRFGANPDGSANPEPSESMLADRRQVLSRLRAEQDLRAALERQEFVLHFQPVVSLATHRTAGFEALLRWQHSGGGLLQPAAFIPRAEASELIVDIGRWAVAAGAAALGRLRREQRRVAPDLPPLWLAVNVSGRHFEAPSLYEDVAGALQAVQLDGASLKLEITETLLMKDIQTTVAVVARLKALGVGLAVDDFGTGYSSLNYLHQLNASCLKVDRSFVSGLESDPGKGDVLSAIRGLATGFRMETVVEGVESAAQARALRQIGFDYAQGYLYSRPLAEEQVHNLIGRCWD